MESKVNNFLNRWEKYSKHFTGVVDEPNLFTSFDSEFVDEESDNVGVFSNCTPLCKGQLYNIGINLRWNKIWCSLS